MTVPDLSTPSSQSRRRKPHLPPPAPRVPWETWYAGFRRDWKLGEHLTIIGTTGTGKTVLSKQLLRIRRHVVIVANKAEDAELERMTRREYKRIGAWPRRVPEDINRFMLWLPKVSSLEKEAMDIQRAILRDALGRLYGGPKGGKPGRWCVAFNEARYVADPAYLGLAREFRLMLFQGRSMFLSVVAEFQKPSWVPTEAYDQPSHLFIAQDNDRRNWQRFREIGGVDGEVLAETIRTLGAFEWAHVDARPGHGKVSIVKVPPELARRA